MLFAKAKKDLRRPRFLQVKAAMIFLVLLVATAREIIMQMKGAWQMMDLLEVTTMVKRYHDAPDYCGGCGRS